MVIDIEEDGRRAQAVADARSVFVPKAHDRLRAGYKGLTGPVAAVAGKADRCTVTTNSTTPLLPAALRSSRDQVARRLSGELAEDAFKPLRLMNGVYLQLHAYMLRVADALRHAEQQRQMRHACSRSRANTIAATAISPRARTSSTTGRNSRTHRIFWRELARSVEMHAIQTSGNCIRNVTADHFAGAAADEVADPRPIAEILRQWSLRCIRSSRSCRASSRSPSPGAAA